MRDDCAERTASLALDSIVADAVGTLTRHSSSLDIPVGRKAQILDIKIGGKR
jgi:hypothetical protein